MGEVAGAYGVRGQIRVHNFSEVPVILTDMPEWLLKIDNQWKKLCVVSAKCHQSSIVAKIDGIDDRDMAASLRHTLVAVYKKALPKAEEDAFYWYELLDMQVINREKQPLGTVKQVIRSPANDILEVADGASEKTYLIPLAASAIDQIDRSQQQILVDWGIDWV